MSISEETVRKLIEARGREQVLDMLREGNYPIPEFLLTEAKPQQEKGQGRDLIREVIEER